MANAIITNIAINGTAISAPCAAMAAFSVKNSGIIIAAKIATAMIRIIMRPMV